MNSDVLAHVGKAHDDNPPGRGSGRYGWGTGENPNQHQFTFLSEYDRLRKEEGLTESQVAKILLGPDGTTTRLRAKHTIESKQQRKINYETAMKLLEKYNGNKSAVGREMGINESTVRSLLDPMKLARMDAYENTAEMLKKTVAEKGPIDVSSGTEHFLGVNANVKSVAIEMLKEEGYNTHNIKIEQLGTGENTTTLVLVPPGMTYAELQKNKYDVKSVNTFTPDNGHTWWTPEFPSSLDSKRVMVRYAEDGGKDRDGTIEIRRGVKDLDLGDANYAQVRIAVDGTNYLKGMALYGDDKDFPKGVDIIYNSNKKRGVPLIDTNATYDPVSGEWSGKEVAKRLKIDGTTGEVDKDNPFGALIKARGQYRYEDAKGKEQLSPLNKLREEGDWDTWSRTLSSQFLAKQNIDLIEKQLGVTIEDKRSDFEEISNLTNPVIKKKLLEDFAETCDASASDLSAKGLKGQSYQVLLPLPNSNPKEVYAPNYKDGEQVALVRFPHAGTFEIPILTVNNRHNSEGKKILGNAKDAIGIHPDVAEILSGADFDGDTAIVIPMSSNKIKIKSTPQLEGLKGFEPKDIYKLPDSAPAVKNQAKQTEMGKVTNLIADMTVGGAPDTDIVKAVKHSMVVIDSEKHHLDYKQSAADNKIRDLKTVYQGSPRAGASTILTRAGSEIYIDKRKETVDVNNMTPEEVKAFRAGKKIYRTVNPTPHYKQITNPSDMSSEELKVYNAGKKVYRYDGDRVPKVKVNRMDTVDDAFELVRDKSNPKEVAYANFANDCKDLANQARAMARQIKPIPVSSSAKQVYASEVNSLNAKIKKAEMNSPREREAQRIANAIASQKIKSNPHLDLEHKKRVRARALEEARAMVGAKKELIEITDKEWEAIQANAISTNKLTKILNNTDQEAFKKRATPKNTNNVVLTAAQVAKLKAMYNSGRYSRADIAEALGISTSTIENYI